MAGCDQLGTHFLHEEKEMIISRMENGWMRSAGHSLSTWRGRNDSQQDGGWPGEISWALTYCMKRKKWQSARWGMAGWDQLGTHKLHEEKEITVSKIRDDWMISVGYSHTAWRERNNSQQTGWRMTGWHQLIIHSLCEEKGITVSKQNGGWQDEISWLLTYCMRRKKWQSANRGEDDRMRLAGHSLPR